MNSKGIDHGFATIVARQNDLVQDRDAQSFR